MKEISVVIPVYNSEGNLEELVKQLVDSLKDYSFEIVFVNDHSKDNSWSVLKSLINKYKNITAINLRRNFGQDGAIMTGFRNAVGKFMVVMDDDLQHSPYDIPQLYNQCINNQKDVCFANFTKREHAAWKNFGSKLNGKVAEIIVGKPKEIYISPFYIIKKEVVDYILEYQGPYPYVHGLIFTITDNVMQIDVKHHKRLSGQSNFNLFRSIKVFLKLATSFSIIPLRFATFVGIISAIFGFLLIPVYLYFYLFTNKIIEGWTTLTILILLLGGLILLCLGIIGEYIGRLYLTTNKRPQSTIDEIITSR